MTTGVKTKERDTNTAQMVFKIFYPLGHLLGFTKGKPIIHYNVIANFCLPIP
ncbi:MAG: hypothetical protein JWN30_762, partial [Bacilli bacterium]|nr:hypothetical protein [Bacilli bacterium]